MNLIKGLLGLLGYGQNKPQSYETPFKDLRNPESAARKPAAFDVEPEARPTPAPVRKPRAHSVEREPVKAAPAPRKPQAVETGRRDDDAIRRSSAQDDVLLNPVTNPVLWATLYGTPATAHDKPAEAPHQTSSDFSKAADDTPALSTHDNTPSYSQDNSPSTTYDSGSSSSSTYDSGSSSSSSYDSGSSSSSFDGGGGGGFDGGGGASFAPSWQ